MGFRGVRTTRLQAGMSSVQTELSGFLNQEEIEKVFVLDRCSRRLQPRWPRGVLSGVPCSHLREAANRSQDLVLGLRGVEPGPISRSEKLCLKHLGTACARHGFCHRLGKAVLRNAEVAESCTRHLQAAVKSSARAWQALQSNAGGWIGAMGLAVHRLPGLGLAIEARRGPVGGEAALHASTRGG